MFHRARVDVENQAYDAGFSAGERTERTRMEKILEAGEENRQADIELGRQLERDRILSLVRAFESLIVKGK
jgi:hypothetical protein